MNVCVCVCMQAFKTFNVGAFALTRVLIPAWVIHYYVKYHLIVSINTIITSKHHKDNKVAKGLMSLKMSKISIHHDDVKASVTSAHDNINVLKSH